MGTPIRMLATMKPRGSKVPANTSNSATQMPILVRVSRSSGGSSSLCLIGAGRNTMYSRAEPIRPSISNGKARGPTGS
ncbi:hypothetical protein D3C84_1131390 [compost metagenome]